MMISIILIVSVIVLAVAFKAFYNPRTRIYIICPVRNMSEAEKNELESYVMYLESLGYKVHYPPRDVDQNDPTGYEICKAHAEALRKCDQVHVYWNPKSTGSHFDLGMVFMLKYYEPGLTIHIIHAERTLYKSYANVLYEMARGITH